jgi:H+/gluconate symporter-like permease
LRVFYDTPETRYCDLSFEEFFGLSMKETFLTWTVLSTLVSVVGLAVILLISMAIA